MFNMTENEQKIYAFLERERRFISPTAIGKQFGCETRKAKHHSSWACKNCRRLIEKGYIIKNYTGQYRVSKKQFEDFTGDTKHAESIINKLLYEVKPCMK